MIEQLELQPVPPTPEERLAELLATLRRAARWVPSRELKMLGFDDRELRSLCEMDAAGAIFSFPGAPGYKFFDLATVQELDRSRALVAQGKKMIARWVRYERRRRLGRAQR